MAPVAGQRVPTGLTGQTAVSVVPAAAVAPVTGQRLGAGARAERASKENVTRPTTAAPRIQETRRERLEVMASSTSIALRTDCPSGWGLRDGGRRDGPFPVQYRR